MRNPTDHGERPQEVDDTHVENADVGDRELFEVFGLPKLLYAQTSISDDREAFPHSRCVALRRNNI